MADPLTWPTVEDAILSGLPPVLRAIVRALGYQRAQEWLRQHGGGHVYLPVHTTTTLGLDAEEIARLNVTLAPHLDDQRRFTAPQPGKLLARARDAEIKRTKATMTIRDQARTHGLSTRHVLNIRRPDDSGQMELL